jgi:ribosomal protein S18 acetylase RimI-like enzyme
MRPIENITKDELLEHLVALDGDGRRLRFGFGISDAGIESYVEGISDNDIILGIRESVLKDNVVAAIHLAIEKDQTSAEMGISTLIHARRKGLAERLLRYAVDTLRNRRIHTMYSICLPDNYPLLSLVKKLNITSITSSPDDKQAQISIPMAGLDSIYNEFENQRTFIIDSSLRPWAKMWATILKK